MDRLNNSIEESFCSEGSMEYKGSFAEYNYPRKYQTTNWKHFKGDLIKTME